MSNDRKIDFNDSILEATDQLMAEDENVILMGLGVTDPVGIFGTTKGLHAKFGGSRVVETPTAENGIMGIAIGSSLVGLRPIVTHQRVEFALLAIEQIVNQAAKWFYMTGGKRSVPMVVRLIIGRGWGQGPQHSQSLDPWFAHVPGLKVVTPANAYDAKGLMIAAVRDPNPVIIMEHRWLHGTFGKVPKQMYEAPIGKAKVVKSGKDITIATYSYMVVEALKAAKVLSEFGIEAEVVDLTSLRPLDVHTINASVNKTGHLIAIDNGWTKFGVAAEVISSVVDTGFKQLKSAPQRLGFADVPIPSTRSLANLVYPGGKEIAAAVEKCIGIDLSVAKKAMMAIEDTPDRSFTGPF